jgi:hypothetical protein
MTTPKITIHSREDLELMLYQNYEVSSLIVNSILKNLKNKKKKFKLIEINIMNEDSIYDIIIDRSNILDSLEKNLKIHEKHEDYESCSKILKAIQYLSINQQKNYENL